MRYFWVSVRHMPLILCLAIPLSMFITYGVAVAYGHVSPVWPYISDTGTKPPESCIFGLLLNTSAFSLCTVIYLRYREVSEFMKLTSSGKITRKWNIVAACLGYISCFGLAIVANFQEGNQLTVHLIGAVLCFFSGIFYFFLQTIFTYKIRPASKRMLWFRIIFTLLNVLFVVGTFLPVRAALNEFKGNNHLIWTEKDGGYTYHLISTFSEWCLVFSFCAYIVTFLWDFRRVQIVPPQIKMLWLEEMSSTEVGVDVDPDESESKPDKETDAKALWI